MPAVQHRAPFVVVRSILVLLLQFLWLPLCKQLAALHCWLHSIMQKSNLELHPPHTLSEETVLKAVMI